MFGETTHFKLFVDRSRVDDDSVMIFVVIVVIWICPKLRLSLHLVVFRIDSKTSTNQVLIFNQVNVLFLSYDIEDVKPVHE